MFRAGPNGYTASLTKRTRRCLVMSSTVTVVSPVSVMHQQAHQRTRERQQERQKTKLPVKTSTPGIAPKTINTVLPQPAASSNNLSVIHDTFSHPAVAPAASNTRLHGLSGRHVLVTKPDSRHTTALLELDYQREISKIGWLRLGRPVKMIDMVNS